MRAAFFTRERTIEVRDAPVPEPGPGDVRLRVLYCGICGSDLSLYKTGALSGPDVVLGHEVSAVVDLDPSGEWPPGTRVTPFPARGCGECEWCRRGEWRHCADPPARMGGGYAELTVYPKRNLIPVPDAVDDLAAALAEPLGVALRAVELSQAQAGDLAYVAGLGPVGLLTVSALSAVGCRVVGADPNAERRTLGLELGCVDAFDPSVRDPADALAAHDPLGPAHTFECSGASASLEQVFDVCAPLGSVGILGIPMAPILLLRMTIKEQRAFSISGPSWESMQGALRHLQQRSEAAKIVTGTVRLEGVGDAMAGLAEGRGGVKTLVDPQA